MWANTTCGVWFAGIGRQPQALLFTLRAIKFIDDRIANPAWCVSFITGFASVRAGHSGMTTPWLATASGLHALPVMVGVVGCSPTLRRQVQAAQTHGPDSPECLAAAGRDRTLGFLPAATALGIVCLMVIKSRLWG